MRLQSFSHLSKITGHTDSISACLLETESPPQSNRVSAAASEINLCYSSFSVVFARAGESHKKLLFFEKKSKNSKGTEKFSDDVRVVWGNIL
jgi:hypothetical protein